MSIGKHTGGSQTNTHTANHMETNTMSKCPTTDLCVQSCKFTIKLGPIGTDGCHSCACVNESMHLTLG